MDRCRVNTNADSGREWVSEWVSEQFLNGTSSQYSYCYIDKNMKKDDVCKLGGRQVQFVVEMGASVTRS